MMGARLKPGAARVIGWGLAYLALAGAIGMELDWGRRIHPPLPVPKPAPAARVNYPIQPEFTLLPLEQGFAETAARPIFSPFRRQPPPPPPPAPPKPAMQKGQFVLLGALITKDKSIALLRDVVTGKATRVEQGKEIKGITVANVLPEKVTLTQYDDSEELVLKIQPLPKPPVAAQAKPPAAAQAKPPAAAQAKPAPQSPAGSGPATPPAPAPFVGDASARSMINSRRAAHGLPPL